MPSSKDFERSLAACGFSAPRFDVVNRDLRAYGRLPNAGRGPHAAQISTLEASASLLAYCGCNRAVKAYERLVKLEGLPSDRDGRSLLATIEDAIKDPAGIQALRISRVRRRARLIRTDGTVELFAPVRSRDVAGRFENEAVIDGRLFENIAAFMRETPLAIVDPDEPEDSE